MPQTVTTSQHRNLHPTSEAIAAMYLYGDEYAAQREGSMDFWDQISESKKNCCRGMVVRILEAQGVKYD